MKKEWVYAVAAFAAGTAALVLVMRAITSTGLVAPFLQYMLLAIFSPGFLLVLFSRGENAGPPAHLLTLYPLLFASVVNLILYGGLGYILNRYVRSKWAFIGLGLIPFLALWMFVSFMFRNARA
jgi:hypothetical protein